MSSKPGQSIEISAQVSSNKESRASMLAKLPLWKQLAILSAWPLLEQLLAFIVGTTDTVIAGRFAEDSYRRAALDALGLGTYVMWLQNILQTAIATGGTALVSRASGANDTSLSRNATQQTILLGGIFGLLLGVSMFFFVPNLVQLFGIQNQQTQALAIEYLRWQACVAPFSGILFAINACRRGSGDTRNPFWVMLIVNGINIFVSWLLTFGPFGNQGITGLAIGTVSGWIVGALVALGWISLPKQELRFLWNNIRFDRPLVQRIVRVGWPNAVEITGMWLFNAILLWMIGQMPESSGLLGAHSIIIRCESVAFLPGFALAMASGALCGQYLGRKDEENAQRALVLTWRVAAVFMGIIGIVFFTRAEQVVALFVPQDERLIELISPILMICGLQQPALATCIILKSTFRAIGDSKTVLLYAYGSQIVLRVGGAWLLALHLEMGLKGIWLAMIADVFMQSIIFACRALRKNWMRVQV